MKIKKLLKAVKQSVKPSTKKVSPPKETAKVESKFPKVGSLLYMVLRGCALFLANVRKGNIEGQPFTDMPKKATAAIAVTETAYGTCVNQVQAEGSIVAVPEKELGFDMKKVGGFTLPLKLAAAWAKKTGKPHTIHRNTAKKDVNEDGYLIGSLDTQYVGWFNSKAGTYDTLETKALPKGRNAKRLFTLVR